MTTEVQILTNHRVDVLPSARNLFYLCACGLLTLTVGFLIPATATTSQKRARRKTFLCKTKPIYRRLKMNVSSVKRKDYKSQCFHSPPKNKVKTFLAKSRGSDGYGERTYNAYLRGFKEFCSWMLREDRAAGTDPMKSHSLIKQTEFRKKRRALTVDEAHQLLEATKAAPKRYNMTGYERSLVYRLALEAGLRAGEIKSLLVLSFDFEAKHKTVHVEPSDTKGKRPADLILMTETAEALKAFFNDKEPTDKAFAMPHSANTAVMLKADLKDAGIEYTDASGRDCDFHSLRHTFITNLALAGVHPAVAQKLARHSSIELTMKYYTHVLYTSEVAAIDALQNLSYTCQKYAQRRTTVDASGRRNLDNGSKTAISA